MRRLVTIIALVSLVFAPQAAAAAHGTGPVTTRDYASTDAVIPNQERGFYHHTETHYRADGSGYVPLNVATLRNFRTQENVTQILRVFYLEKFAGQDQLDKAYLDLVRADFRTIRAAGIKAIVRFAYAQPPGWPPTIPYGDAPLARVQKHIAQLTPILRENADVIAVVQSGFVGLWGEGYYTDYFADPRRWPAGTTTTLDKQVCAPAVPGTYRLLLNLADPAPRLQSQDPLPGSTQTYNSAYAIQLANTGTWQAATGYNDLGQTLTVTPQHNSGGCGNLPTPQLIR